MMRPFYNLLLAVCLPILGCSETAPTLLQDLGTGESILFPTQERLANAYMEALLFGELAEEDGCLVVRGEVGRHVPIWPKGFTLREEGGNLVIRGNERQASARLTVGSRIQIGGGYVGDEGANLPNFIDSETQAALLQRCPGSYFIVGDATTGQ